MGKVYVVFAGIYSNRDVVYVASSKEKAEEFNRHHSSQPMEICEYDVDSELPAESVYSVYFRTYTRFDGEKVPEDCICNIVEDDERCDDVWRCKSAERDRIEDHWQIFLRAKDTAEAMKAARERLMVVKASPEMYPDLFNDKTLFNNHEFIGYGFFTKKRSDI